MCEYTIPIQRDPNRLPVLLRLFFQQEKWDPHVEHEVSSPPTKILATPAKHKLLCCPLATGKATQRPFTG